MKVKGERSPYDGGLVYWSSRLGRHPELSKAKATLLKKQKGKCAYCGLHFQGPRPTNDGGGAPTEFER